MRRPSGQTPRREMEADEEARECFDAMVELVDTYAALRPRAADAYAEYGHYLDGVGDFAGAMRMFRRELPLVEGHPRNLAFALSNLANAMDSHGQVTWPGAHPCPPALPHTLWPGANPCPPYPHQDR